MPRGQFHYQPGKIKTPTRRRSKLLSVVRAEGRGTEQPVLRPVTTPSLPRERPPRPPVPTEIDLGGDESGPVIRQALLELVRAELGRSTRELHPRFKQGKVIAKNGDRSVEIGAERFFSVLDRLRSSLEACERALERRSAKFEPAELSEMKAGLRAVQGSLTTFNIMFADKEDYFSSKD
jgi:hypothetical protein